MEGVFRAPMVEKIDNKLKKKLACHRGAVFTLGLPHSAPPINPAASPKSSRLPASDSLFLGIASSLVRSES